MPLYTFNSYVYNVYEGSHCDVLHSYLFISIQRIGFSRKDGGENVI